MGEGEYVAGMTLFRLRRAFNICSKFCFVLFSVGEKPKLEAEEPSTGEAGFDGPLYSPLAHRACAGGNKTIRAGFQAVSLWKRRGRRSPPSSVFMLLLITTALVCYDSTSRRV